MAVNLSPIGGVAAQFFDNSGNILSGGKIFTYAAGTTTPQATYTSSSGVTAHSNPIILDAAGRVPGGEIWLTDGSQYKFLIKTSTDVQIGSYDNINGINSNFVNYTNSQEFQTATAGQTVFTLTTMQYQPGTRSLSVFVDGVNQYGPGAPYAYQETSSTVVTFTSGLHVGADVKFTTSVINASSYGDAQQIAYNAPFTGSVATNVEAKLAQTISVKDFGAVGDGVTDDTTAIQAAFTAANTGTVYIPAGIYKTSSSITTLGSWYGDGEATSIRPTGDFPAFTVLSAKVGGGGNGFARDYVIDYSGVATLTVQGSAHWFNKGATSASLFSTSNFKMSNVLIYNAYHALYQSSADVAIFWNVSFDNVKILRSRNYGIYLDMSGNPGTLQVSFDNILIDGDGLASSKGAYFNALAQLNFRGVCSGVNNGVDLGTMNISNCSKVAIDVQTENFVCTTPSARLISFANCQYVEAKCTFTSITTNVGGGNKLYYVYLDANCQSAVIHSIFDFSPTVTSGTKYKLYVSAAATTTAVKILDKTILSSESDMPSVIRNSTQFLDLNVTSSGMTSTGYVQDSNLAQFKSSAQTSVSTTTAIYTWTDNNNVAAEVQPALLLVSGTNSANTQITFADLVVVISSTNAAFTRQAFVISSDGVTAPAARTYSIAANGSLALAMASGTYLVRASAIQGYAPYR